MKNILIIISVSLFALSTYTLSVQSQEKDCSKRDPFETEQEFKERCKKLSAVPSVPKSADQKSVLSDLRKSPFETEGEFEKRCNQMIEFYNQAVSRRDPLYQAGTAHLDKDRYDIETGDFPLTIAWQDWAMKIFVIEKGSINAWRDDAKALWQENEQKPLPIFISLKMTGNIPVAEKAVLLGKGKEWEIFLGISSFNPVQMINPVKDSFETDEQFQARNRNLLEMYNRAAKQHDERFRAGTAVLDKENYGKSGKELFPLNIKWETWAEKQFDLYTKDSIIAEHEEAITLWKEGEQKSVFVFIDNTGKIRPVLIGLDKEWELKSLVTATRAKKRKDCLSACNEKCPGSYVTYVRGRATTVFAFPKSLKVYNKDRKVKITPEQWEKIKRERAKAKEECEQCKHNCERE